MDFQDYLGGCYIKGHCWPLSSTSHPLFPSSHCSFLSPFLFLSLPYPVVSLYCPLSPSPCLPFILIFVLLQAHLHLSAILSLLVSLWPLSFSLPSHHTVPFPINVFFSVSHLSIFNHRFRKKKRTLLEQIQSKQWYPTRLLSLHPLAAVHNTHHTHTHHVSVWLTDML